MCIIYIVLDHVLMIYVTDVSTAVERITMRSTDLTLPSDLAFPAAGGVPEPMIQRPRIWTWHGSDPQGRRGLKVGGISSRM